MLKSIHDVVLDVAEASHMSVCICQLAHVTVERELSKNVRVWEHSLVKDVAPIESSLHQVCIVALHGDLKESSEQTRTVLHDVSHVRDQTECLERSILQVGFKEHEYFCRCLIDSRLLNFNKLALRHENV